MSIFSDALFLNCPLVGSFNYQTLVKVLEIKAGYVPKSEGQRGDGFQGITAGISNRKSVDF